jgi:hypothetical protein
MIVILNEALHRMVQGEVKNLIIMNYGIENLLPNGRKHTVAILNEMKELIITIGYQTRDLLPNRRKYAIQKDCKRLYGKTHKR